MGTRTIEVTINDGTTDGPASVSEISLRGPGLVFTVIADAPYHNGEFPVLEEVLSNLPEETRFVIHLGDIKSGSSSVNPDTYFSDVASTLQTSTKPIFIILGDNEYNDSPDPEGYFSVWKDNFLYFDQNWSHGIGTMYQDVRPENFSFVIQDTLFVGINLVGSAIHDSDEWAERSADDLVWLQENFAQFGAETSNAVIFEHAFPGHNGYEDFETGFVDLAQDFDRPILYMMGDLHNWTLDNPYSSAPNITRVIVDRTSSLDRALHVTVDNDPDDPFAANQDIDGSFL